MIGFCRNVNYFRENCRENENVWTIFANISSEYKKFCHTSPISRSIFNPTLVDLTLNKNIRCPAVVQQKRVEERNRKVVLCSAA
jgi:hypothetical protein